MTTTKKSLTRVGIIGFGKRVKTFYSNILKKLNDEFYLAGFTKKTDIDASSISEEHDLPYYNDIKSLLNQELDIIIVSVPAESINQVLTSISNFKGVVLIDTPISFNTEEFGLRSFAIEQWPFLPIEQFKKQLISSKVFGGTVFAENDTRTFEYHSISQLKSYFDKSEQISNISNSPNIIGGKDCWSIGTVNFASGKGFLYKFSYFSKKSKFRPQQIKVYLENGGIITGCFEEKGNDYEIMKAFTESQNCPISIKRSSQEISNKETSFHSGNNFFELDYISCETPEKTIKWVNRFKGLGFNDQEISIASIFTEAQRELSNKDSSLISTKSSFEDYFISRTLSQ
jgi:hypothetical protein